MGFSKWKQSQSWAWMFGSHSVFFHKMIIISWEKNEQIEGCLWVTIVIALPCSYKSTKQKSVIGKSGWLTWVVEKDPFVRTCYFCLAFFLSPFPCVSFSSSLSLTPEDDDDEEAQRRQQRRQQQQQQRDGKKMLPQQHLLLEHTKVTTATTAKMNTSKSRRLVSFLLLSLSLFLFHLEKNNRTVLVSVDLKMFFRR